MSIAFPTFVSMLHGFEKQILLALFFVFRVELISKVHGVKIPDNNGKGAVEIIFLAYPDEVCSHDSSATRDMLSADAPQFRKKAACRVFALRSGHRCFACVCTRLPVAGYCSVI